MPPRPRLPLLVVLLLAIAGAAGGEKPAVEFSAGLAFDGWCRSGFWSALILHARNRGPDIAAVASVLVPGDSTEYARAFDLPRNSAKRIEVPFLPWFLSGRLLVRVRLASSNEILWESASSFPVRELPETLVLVAGRRAAAACRPFLTGEPTRPEVAGEVFARPVDPDQLPEDPRAWSSLQSLVLADPDDGALSPAQARALAAWVRLGGHLVHLWHPAWHPDATLTAEIEAPVDVRGSSPLPRADAERVFPALAIGTPLETAEAVPLPGAVVLLACAGRPLLVEQPCGRGQVTWIGADLSAQPWVGWKDVLHLWRRALAPALSPQWDPDREAWTVAHENTRLRRGLGRDLPFRWLSPWWLLLFAGAYAWAIGPGTRRLRGIPRPLAPLVVVAAFSAAAWLLSRHVLAGRPHARLVARVILPAAGAPRAGDAFGMILLPDNARLTLASPREDVRFALLPEGFGPGILSGTAAGWSDATSRLLSRPSGAAFELTARTWTAEFFSAHWEENDGAPPIRARIAREGSIERLHLDNATGAPLEDIFLLRDGAAIPLSRHLNEATAVWPLGFFQRVPLGPWLESGPAPLEPPWSHALLSLSCVGPREGEEPGEISLLALDTHRPGHNLRLLDAGLARGKTGLVIAWSARPVTPIDLSSFPVPPDGVTLWCVEVDRP